jgi:hypothetical protein
MHYVARELGERWRGHRILACRADSAARTLTIWSDENGPVSFDLATLTVREARGHPIGTVLRGWTIVEIVAPTDERRITIQCERRGRFRGSPSRHGAIDVSFVPNARGAVVRDAGNTLARLGGALPPVSDPRPILDDAAVVAAVNARDDAAMLRGRWMSAGVCALLFARGDRALSLFHMIMSLPIASPMRCGALVVPLPLCDDGTPLSSLILPAGGEADAVRPPVANRATKAAARMRRELERARDAPRLRAIADAVMALGSDAPIPAQIVLPDGAPVEVPRSDDPAETPVALAERLYREAKAMERALERLPARIEALEADPATASVGRVRTARTPPPVDGKRLPFKSYRSSGGIEILVGRGARSNDELTYEIARPDDIWLHARDVTGAHVVMRWTQDGAPPGRDLEEAAALAAWHSRARGSVVVPVDWTRRRYVRRARGGPAGRALVERAKTVMAGPSAELERRLRMER